MSSWAAAVACWSWIVGAEAPTTTILSRSLRGSTSPRTSDEKETVGTLPGRPLKSM
jgi:hypothetical protein